jgi:hypothetical protein
MKKSTILTGVVASMALLVLAAGCSEAPLSSENADALDPSGTIAGAGPALFDVPTGDDGPAMYEPNIVFCGTSAVVDLWAGQTTDAGSVTIYNDEVNLYLTVYSALGYQDNSDGEQIKIWAGGDLANMPRNGAGNPVIGQFPYKLTTSGGTTYTVTIPLDDLSLVNDCGDEVFVVVHADVLADDGNGGTSAETAFGGDTGGDTGNRWWYYTTYTIQCCDTPPVFDYCETAFAKGGYVFTTHPRANPEDLPSLELIRNRWGWAIEITGDGQLTYDIWAGAGLNDTDRGTLVGQLTVTKTGSEITVAYDLNTGFAMQEAHIYAGATAPTTVAPGQYGYTEYFEPMVDAHSMTFTVEGDTAWIVAHAVVCW